MTIILDEKITVKVPATLAQSLRQEAIEKELNLSQLCRRKLAGTNTQTEQNNVIKVEAEKKEVLDALTSFFSLFQKLVNEKRIQLNKNDIGQLKTIQEVAGKYE